ncbi:MAG TPA: PaaI family thioesterase [Jatrophihabitans sp.]|nr:PaaI family thioesterase [Jatrophihabitans sp.]
MPEPGSPHLPDYPGCWGCGPGSALGLVPPVAADGDHLRSVFALGPGHQGSPGAAHGGVLAALLDEAFGTLVWRRVAGRHATARQEVDFRAPLPLPATVAVDVWIAGRDGRKTWLTGRATNEDTELVVAEGRALFVRLR